MKKKYIDLDNISGQFLDADNERLITIDLPLVQMKEEVYYQGKKLHARNQEFGEFILMGDFHYGLPSFSANALHGYLNYLLEHPNILIGIMGDIVEYGQVSRFIKDDEKIPIDGQIEMFVNDFKPVAKRIRFMLWGNHEERFVKQSQSKKFMESLVRELGLKPGIDLYVGEPQKGVFVVFKAGEKTYGAQFHHSRTNARVNQDIQLARAGSQNLVSIIGHGHTHRLIWKPRTFRSLEKGPNDTIVNTVRRQYLLATGCFLKYPGYAEASSYPYTEVGAPIVRFSSKENSLSEYDLTGIYRGYLNRGGLAYHSQFERVELSHSFAQTAPCPSCSSVLTMGWGNYIPDPLTGKPRQRRLCTVCGKWFQILRQD